jgi:hypothetical protein
MRKILLSMAALGFSHAFEIKPIHSMLEISQYITPKTLLVTDIDHTLIEPTTYEGSEPWFQNMISLSLSHEKAVAIDFYCRIQPSITMRAVEPDLPAHFQAWSNNKDVITLGLTSRSYCLAATTHQQLAHIGMSFSNIFFEDSAMPEIMNQGIMFASGRNKGLMLSDFLKSYPDYLDWQIIFVDDSLPHLEHVGRVLESNHQNIAKPLLFHYPTSRARYEAQRFVPPFENEETPQKKHLGDCRHSSF